MTNTNTTNTASSATTRIYRVQVGLDPATCAYRLVRAAHVAQAIRHVAASMLVADVASQEDLVTLLAQETHVEDASLRSRQMDLDLGT
jgi:hypothetical protein